MTCKLDRQKDKQTNWEETDMHGVGKHLKKSQTFRDILEVLAFLKQEWGALNRKSPLLEEPFGN